MKFLVLLVLVGFAGIITQQVFAENSPSFDSTTDFSEIDFDTGRFSYLPYGEKFYQYKSQPFGALAGDSSSRCHFTSSFVLSKESLSESGNILYRFPKDMVWPGGYENSTFYIVRSPSFNFPEDNHFERLTPTKTEDSIVLEFEIGTGLSTFVANSTTFWDTQKSQIIDCLNPFDFEKQEYKYYDFVYPLKVQQNYAKIFGLTSDFLCKDELIPVLKHDNSPACVKPETISKLIERGWTTQSIVQDIVMKTLSKNLGPECSQNTMNEIMNGKVDERCAKFIDELATKRQSDMVQQGYVFDQEIKSWTKKGYPDMLMNIVDYYQQNLKNSKITHESKSGPLDIASIEDRYIHLNPADMCATISLELMSPDEAEQRKSGIRDIVFLEFDEKDIEEMPILDELIRATHHLEFPANDHSNAEMDMRELVDYEFFIMEKAIEKYDDSKEDYFMKLDPDLDERLADPRKQGFSNEFIAPQIIYDDNVYVLSHTVFWVSDEHEMQSMSVHLKENIDESKKIVTLNHKDMESIPKIREAIERIGTELESVVAFKGLSEEPDWNEYREWYTKKSAEQFDTDDVHVSGFVYEDEYYDLGFLIC